MRRSTALRLLFVAFPLLVGVAVTAAPAPVYKPKPPVVPWVTGWDMPVDPLGDCQFAKAGDKLTITVPGAAERTTAPHMLREIEGDFDVTVRVTGSFRQEGRAAGVVITDGTNDFRFCRASNQNKSLTVMVAVPTSKGILNGVSGGSDGDDPELVFIRIERRKNILDDEVQHGSSEVDGSLRGPPALGRGAPEKTEGRRLCGVECRWRVRAGLRQVRVDAREVTL